MHRSAYSNRFYAMGTRFYMIVPGLDESAGHRLFVQVKREVDRIERKISRYDAQSDLSRLNQVGPGQEARVDEEFFDILKACKACWEITDGAFDPALPASEQKLAVQPGMHHVHLMDDERTVRLEENTKLDLGGFGKGYALEKIHDLFRQRGVKRAFINFGDSSVLAAGTHPSGGDWKIGIRHATEPHKSAFEFSIRDASVSTSGNFYINDEGKPVRHHHIVHPKTGMMEEHPVTMSVRADSSLLAEMLSTAFLVMSEDQIKRVMSLYDHLAAAKVDYSAGTDQPEITEYNSNQSNEQVEYEDQSEKVS